MKFSYWLKEYNDNQSQSVRLGQHFCNEFIKNSWSELFYTEDKEFAISLIVDYLVNVSMTYPDMPRKYGEI